MVELDNKEKGETLHPSDSFLHPEIFPTVWCPGCGIGTAASTLFEAIKEADILKKDMQIVSGIGCTGKIAECVRFKSYSITNGKVVDFAIHLKQAKPGLKVCVFLNNADILLSGAEQLIKAGKKRENLIVIFINNFIYAVSQDKAFPLTPFMRKSTSNEFELPFDIPGMAIYSGADFVARWTPLQAGWMKDSFREAFSLTGLAVIEVISPCLIYEANSGRILDAVDRIKFYNDNSEIKFQAKGENLDIRLQKKIITGKFKIPEDID